MLKPKHNCSRYIALYTSYDLIEDGRMLCNKKRIYANNIGIRFLRKYEDNIDMPQPHCKKKCSLDFATCGAI